MFWKIVGLISSWIGAFVIVRVFGPRFNPLFVIPVLLTFLFVYYRWLKKIRFSEMRRGWILVISSLCEIGILTETYSLLKFLSLSLFPEIIIGLGGVITAMVVGFLLIYFWWAPNNLYFSFVPEGRAKIVVRGDAYEKTIIQWVRHVLATQKTDGVDIDDVIEGEEHVEAKGWLRRVLAWLKRLFGGLRYYGFWPIKDIYLYDFAWTNMAQNGKIVEHGKKTLDYVLLKEDVYLAVVLRAEDKDLLPVDVYLVLTIRIINPYKAIFIVQNWLETVINRITPAVRNVLTTDSYSKWISSKKDLAQRIQKALKKFLEKECREHYGAEIRAIEVRDIDPGEKYREVTLKKYSAERERDRILVEADAEKQRISTVYQAVKDFNDLGKLIRSLEAIEKSPEKGAKWIIPLPGMSGFFPGRETNSLKPEEIRWLRETIEKSRQD